MACYLRAFGKDFDVDVYLADHPCEVSNLYHKGDPEFKSKPDGRKLEASGFSVYVSDVEMDDLKTQISEAIEFLRDEVVIREIPSLVSYPGVEEVSLDFGVTREGRDKFPVKWYYFPPELLKLAGTLGVGLEMSFYLS